jgi:hypothetical protein
MYGAVRERASQAGLVLSRDRVSSGINLRYRDPRTSAQVWRDLTIAEAMAVVLLAE